MASWRRIPCPCIHVLSNGSHGDFGWGHAPCCKNLNAKVLRHRLVDFFYAEFCRVPVTLHASYRSPGAAWVECNCRCHGSSKGRDGLWDRPASYSRLVSEVSCRNADCARPVRVQCLADKPSLPRNRRDFVEGVAGACRTFRMGDNLPAASLIAGAEHTVRMTLAKAHGAKGVTAKETDGVNIRNRATS